MIQSYNGYSLKNQRAVFSNKPTHQYNNDVHIPRGHCKLATRFVFSKTLCFVVPLSNRNRQERATLPINSLGPQINTKKKKVGEVRRTSLFWLK